MPHGHAERSTALKNLRKCSALTENLRLACTHRDSPMHHISDVPEARLITDPGSQAYAYLFSKAVATVG